MTWWQKARKLGHFHPASHCERRMALSSSPSCLPHKSLPPATSSPPHDMADTDPQSFSVFLLVAVNFGDMSTGPTFCQLEAGLQASGLGLLSGRPGEEQKMRVG